MDEPPQKRVKAEAASSSGLPPLPPGWTEHTAPTGHKYYYNKATKKSTYTRPAPVVEAPPIVEQPPVPQHAAYASSQPSGGSYADTSINGYQQSWDSPYGSLNGHSGSELSGRLGYGVPHSHSQASDFSSGMQASQGYGHSQPQQSNGPRRPRFEPRDRPKRKEVIPNCGTWVLVYTKLGRRFVHNTKTRESYWKFPADVMKAVIAFDQLKLEEKHGKAPTNGSSAPDVSSSRPGTESAADPATIDPELNEQALAQHQAETAAALKAQQAEDAALLAADEEERVWVPPAQTDKGYDSSEYEEIYVTDDSDAESAADDDSLPDEQPAQDGPLEFNEDDIAWQLAAMEEDYGLDQEDYADDYTPDPDAEDNAADDTADATATFHTMLTDHGISPFTPWETLISNSSPLLDDERFTVLPSSRVRRAAHAEWVKLQAAARAAMPKAPATDPRIVFLQLLSEKAKPSLYWAEFKRKFRKEAALKGGRAFGEREMEKAYREYVAGMKKSVSEREAELKKVLREGKGDVKSSVAYWLVGEEERERIVGGN